MHVWDTPMYPAAMIGRLIDLHPSRIRRWLFGYEYSYALASGHRTTHHQGPVVIRDEAEDSRYASFLDLIDLLFVKQFLDKGVQLQTIRQALEEAAIRIGSHHFAQRTFFTDGKNIFLEMKGDGNAILELLSNGQWTIAPIIKNLAKQIVFDEEFGYAKRWYPAGENGHIVIDPSISFGKPFVLRAGITTENIYDLYIGEGHNLKNVCSWLNIEEGEAKAAIKFEDTLATR